MKKKLIFTLTILSILNLSTIAFATTETPNDLPNPILTEEATSQINLLPETFVSDISFSENNITNISDVNIKNSSDELISPRMYYYELQLVNRLSTQKNVFVKKHPMDYWAMIPSQKPYFDVGSIRTVSVSSGTSYNWNTGASINLGVSVNKSSSVSSPVKAYANKYCTVGIFSDVTPARYYEVKKVKGSGHVISKTPVTVYAPTSTKYNGVYQGQKVKGINNKTITVK